ncbi:uncharacterized protein LOC108673437 isoform X3 [Hyalella azteca]|uniref:Uncharacterized protein LOC108673437 isoform X3 n=1 Tax=Hyalella azteca TaxID=294128 RepID=A0A8B7NSS5_HYAAZ|nr:uncharacterized protein LOC108673437 isoform X3 [Hyalella azteca]
MATDEESVEPRGDTVWSVFLDILWWMPEMLASSVEHWTWWLRGGGSSDTMDTLNTLLLGWLFSAILILGLLKLLYDKFLRGDEDEVYIDDVTKAAAVSSTDEVRTETSPQQQQQQEERRVPTIVPAVSALPAGSAGAAAGQDADAVRWINTVMAWLYRGPHSAIAGPYLSLLNDMTARTALETGVLIEVVELLPATPSPVLRNIVVDCAADDSMSVTCDCETSLFLRVQTTRTHRDVTTESEYAAAVQPMRGRLNAAILPHACKTVIKFDGWPEVNIELEGIRNNEKGLGEKELQEVIKEVLSSAIRSMDLEVDLSTDASFPRFKRGRELPDTVVPVGYDSMVPSFTTAPQPLGLSALNGKRLLVKIVKATGVGCNKSSVNAYVIVEMDEPNQKFTTATIKETDSPFWDEQFLFELSDMTLELLFELYDECDNSFLGLGIVGIEELVATPSQRQIIPLQARPYEDDAVSGTLTVEFLFLDGGDLPDLTVRCSKVQQSISPQGERVKTTTTTYTKLPLATETMVNGHDSVTASALRGLEQTSTAATQPVTANAKSTVIIHASKKEPAKKLIQVSRLPGGEYSEREDSYSQFDEEPMLDEPEEGTDSDDNYVVNTLQYPFPTTGSSSLPPTKASSVVETSSAASTAAAARESPYGHSADTGDENIELEDDGRGRSRNKPKKESFFGTLKKRFSRSKVRSQSMEPSSQRAKRGRSPPNDAPRTATVGRSVSMERSAKLRPTEPKEEKRKSLPTQNSSPQSSSEHHSTSPSHYLYLLHRQGLLSVPKRGSREPAELRSDTGSARSSLSETSGLSSSSTRTYVNEASMLIIEALENGVLRHYLVPVSLQQRNRWRKRGTKLHVFCAHTFVAKHISSSLNCAVCERSFNRRLGKQGYECRDCGLKCHKPCHVRTELQCPASTVNDMDLEYIRDPREERKQKNQKL